MGRKIIILNGSPRRNGNTAMLCDAFTQGAEGAGHTVTRFNLQDMDIHGCLGCMKGGKDSASPCMQKDDMEKIYPVYTEADIIVLASPLYFWTYSGQLRIAFDRLFAVAEGNPGYASPKKDCILLMAAGSDTSENWKPVLDYHASMLGFLGWTDKGKVLAGGVLQPGDIRDKSALEEARQLGASL